MHRREFIKHLALISAGALALPTHVDAFERAFTLNAPQGVHHGLIAINEIFIGGLSGYSQPMQFEFWTNGKPDLVGALNLFGGVYVWTAGSAQPMRISTTRDLTWKMTTSDRQHDEPQFLGSIRYCDQDGLWHTVPFRSASGCLATEIGVSREAVA